MKHKLAKKLKASKLIKFEEKTEKVFFDWNEAKFNFFFADYGFKRDFIFPGKVRDGAEIAAPKKFRSEQVLPKVRWQLISGLVVSSDVSWPRGRGFDSSCRRLPTILCLNMVLNCQLDDRMDDIGAFMAKMG